MNVRKHGRSFFLFSFFFIFIVSAAVCFGQVTPPEDYLGFKPGADFHLANYEQAIGYFELIAGQTDRMQVFDMGPTSYGRRMKYAVISSAENMAKLARFKEINRKLSLARGVSRAEAEKLADEGKAVVWIDCGLHASETSPAQHALQLAYDIVTGNDRRTRLIRKNVIFLLVFANPDGLTMISDWYKKNLGTQYEVSPLPRLYQKYAGHDNNRDSFIANLQEVQNMNRVTCHEWYPEILFNQHETAPFPARIWIPPESEPMNPNLHPIVVRWKNLIGAAMGKAFEEAGQPGAISRINFDSWYPGYVTQFVGGHNIPSILTETANYRYATPHYYTLYDFPKKYQDLVKGVFYPDPWWGGWWHLGDAVAYELTASKSVLEVAAKFKYEFLFNKWRIATDVIERFKKEPPYGWIISADQRDQNSTAQMLNRCILNGTEVYKAEEKFAHNGITYPKGTYIIPTSQPFGLFVKHIFERQDYPDLRKYTYLWQGIVGTEKPGKEPIRAYDGAGWTLPIQMGADYHEITSPLPVKTTLVDTVIAPAGTVKGGGSVYVFSPADNGSFLAVNRLLQAGGKVSYALAGFTLREKKYPKGTLVLQAGSVKRGKLKEISAAANISLHGGKIQVKTRPIVERRIALYKSWVPSIDEGWISYMLEKYQFPYHELTNAEVKAGNLNKRFDVIILPDQRPSSIINGFRKGTIPLNYVGGITLDGVENLKEFVLNGGTLICNKGSVDLPVKQFKFPIRNRLQKVKPDSFSCPGSLLKVNYDITHPLAFGQQKKGFAFFSRGWAFVMISDTVDTGKQAGKKETAKQENNAQKGVKKTAKKEKIHYAKVKPEIIASYPDENLLISGWVLGDKLIRRKAAILNVPFGKGDVVLFGFNVHNRCQSYGNFKLLFNAIFY